MPSPVDRTTRLTILLVEDEPALRQLMATALQTEGYRVLEARHGHEALRVFSAHEGEIVLVATDVMMPYLQGTDMVAALRAIRPDLKVLFLTGHPAASIDHEPHLWKPFSHEQFLEAVETLLATP